MPKYTLLGLAVLIFFAPLSALADDYSPPKCPGSQETKYDDSGKIIQGTCKEIKTPTVVTLDPVIEKDYFLGEHHPIALVCSGERGGNCIDSEFSEEIFLQASSTISEYLYADAVEKHPNTVAVFDKKYFVPLLKNLFTNSNLTFDEKNIPEIRITVLEKSEIDAELKKPLDEYNRERLTAITSVKTDVPLGSYKSYDITTFNAAEYGKYINGPKWTLKESQYVPVEVSPNALTDADLQITRVSCGRWGMGECAVAPITSPLKAVKNHWIFTKKNGKLVLAWQKSEYTLDNGTVKIITAADKNVNAALLFGGKAVAATTTAVTTPTATSPTPVVPEKKGFFAAFFDWLFWWL